MPQGLADSHPEGDNFEKALSQKDNQRHLCSISTILDASWHSDFAKLYPTGLVQLEVQFGKVRIYVQRFLWL